ncbi:HAMP domain-containing sensor histidine kinase [Cellulomonas sp.]|uniref:sensor histidine kinase n=1 Tax=Cellulomonas sp. TaxID=40001 RepID=UPI001B22937E|nr:HAMP domain-containing sensor histidine kinase [Cellulomonas sp.]MBO9555145.1 HAMP domain-containing histidine kinase [Cellulomonas sp.]
MSRDLWFMTGVTAVCAVVVGALGVLVVGRVRRASLVAALVVTALVPTAVVALALWFNVGAMFLSDHDAQVARLVLGLSCVPAVVLAVVLGRMLVADVRAVGVQARALASGQPPAGSTPVTAELAALADELARTRARLDASRERERALESARRQVVAFVSHDLRSPLSGIRATVDGLRDGVLVDTDAAYAGIDAATERLGRMIDDLAELSRPDPAPTARAPERVSLSAVLDDVLAHSAAGATAQQVTLLVDVEPGLEVLGVPDELARVLDNLVGNAVRSSGAGGTVRVAGYRVDGEVRVAVEDTCGGIPDDERAHVFDEGFQGSGPHRTHAGAAHHAGVGSSGLGLAIVDSVVAAHGGRVGVEPTEAGCLFEVQLPANAGAPD